MMYRLMSAALASARSQQATTDPISNARSPLAHSRRCTYRNGADNSQPSTVATTITFS